MRIRRRLKTRRPERVALARIPALEAPPEPPYALGGRPVGEGVRRDVAARLLLETVIADGARGLEGLLDVALLEDLELPLRVMGPDAGEEVGLELEPHRELVVLGLAHASAGGLDLVADPEEVLHVVPDLVRYDVGLREVSGRAVSPPQVLVEGEVDVELLIGRAVERTHRRLRETARRLGRLFEEDELGLTIGLTLRAEQVAPDLLGVGEDDRDEMREIVLLAADRRF